jgi:hypothetical protein
MTTWLMLEHFIENFVRRDPWTVPVNMWQYSCKCVLCYEGILLANEQLHHDVNEC